jgi:hypothetical protein
VQLQQPKAPSIFVNLDRRTPPWLIVSGKTWPRNRDLGFEGLGFKWNPNKKAWEKLWSLRDFEALEAWPEVGVSPEAREKARQSRQSAARQQEYYRQRAQQPPKTKLKPFTSEEREARLQLIEENRKKREAETEARRTRGEFKEIEEKIARWEKETREKMARRGQDAART